METSLPHSQMVNVMPSNHIQINLKGPSGSGGDEDGSAGGGSACGPGSEKDGGDESHKPAPTREELHLDGSKTDSKKTKISKSGKKTKRKEKKNHPQDEGFLALSSVEACSAGNRPGLRRLLVFDEDALQQMGLDLQDSLE